MDIFQTIKQNISIVQVASEYTTLKQAGSYLKGRCPFHHENTPSFTVSPEKNIFYCFGCHIGGDVIAFTAHAKRCSQHEAARSLAEQYSLDIPAFNTNSNKDSNTYYQSSEKEKYYLTHQVFTQWAHDNLYKNSIVQKYIASRNINNNSVKYFILGYVPKLNINKLLSYAQKFNLLAEDFINAHIILKNKTGQKLYTPFENRLIFPIANYQGKICGFGARLIENETSSSLYKQPKYYNSHEHDFFNKRSLLYNFYNARKSIQKKGCAFIVEGYTDVIAMHQHNYTNTIATLGTACTQDHIKTLSRYTQKLYILFDTDTAGQNAILRLTDYCFTYNIELFVISLPEKEDPASYLSKHNTINDYINKAQDIFSFYINFKSKDFSSKNTQEKIDITKDFLYLIYNVEDPVKKELLLQKAASAFNISLDTLKQELQVVYKRKKRVNHFQQNSPKTITSNKEEHKKIDPLQKMVIYRLFNLSYQELNNLDTVDKELLYILISKHLKSIIEKLIQLKSVNTSQQDELVYNLIIDKLTSQENNYLASILLSKNISTTESFRSLLNQFYQKRWKSIVYAIKTKTAELEQQNKKEQVAKLVSYFLNIKNKLQSKGLI